eukprot:TRINITY_DN33774_c0_g1_i1.p1 TRINITY_DN33774_c0_g1~~TRINITY_DN33774_c0_g1_i1.p1  ORF type:complete len:726 (+),score=157.26 TRINITY_DN33774_c0_g1_i1:45-2180(+)
MATFKVRVACDLYGSKHNAMFLFKPPPSALDEIIAEAQRFYQEEAENRKPAGNPGPAFQIVALQIYAVSGRWEDVVNVDQLTDGCQLYAFQQQNAAHQDNFGAIPEAITEDLEPAFDGQRPITVQTVDGPRELQAFEMLDLKKDGIITLDEMVEAFQGLHLRFTPSQVQDLFVVADEDRDGVVTREEFDKFAVRFPTVIDSIHQKKIDDEVLEKGQVVLRDAQAALHAEQEVEKKLLEDAASASKRVRDLMGQIADHKMNQEVALQRKPVVEAQQQQLIEQELALAAQKEKLKQAQEDIRRDIEEQLNNVSTSVGLIHRELTPTHHQQQAYPDALQEHISAQVDEGRQVSASSNTSSFFLPSESPRVSHPQQGHSHLPAAWDDSLPPTPATRPKLPVGTEVEACNFETKPEFNGLRGKVVALREDGKIAVDFVIRGGLTLDMLANNIRAVPSPTFPPIGTDVETTGPAKATAGGFVDLRGQTGKVVGCRSGTLLCEFPPKAGLFEIKPQHVLPMEGPPSGQQIMSAVTELSKRQAPQDNMAIELEKARREAEVLRKELNAERTKSRSQAPQSPNPEVQAALERLGNLSSPQGANPFISALPTSPVQFPPTLVPSSLLPTTNALNATDTSAVWSSNARNLSPARHAKASNSPAADRYTSLLPSTQEILNKVHASMSPPVASGASVAATLAGTPPSLKKPTTYSLGPIDLSEI